MYYWFCRKRSGTLNRLDIQLKLAIGARIMLQKNCIYIINLYIHLFQSQ